ncbi:unnamed protein product, partial [Closterium sp. Yama58-4]
PIFSSGAAVLLSPSFQPLHICPTFAITSPRLAAWGSTNAPHCAHHNCHHANLPRRFRCSTRSHCLRCAHHPPVRPCHPPLVLPSLSAHRAALCTPLWLPQTPLADCATAIQPSVIARGVCGDISTWGRGGGMDRGMAHASGLGKAMAGLAYQQHIWHAPGLLDCTLLSNKTLMF